VLAAAAAMGLLLGSIRLRGIDLGIVGVLVAGLLLGHLGVRAHPVVLEFARDLGLVLFVYAIGVQTGPGFVDSLRRQGLRLNATAVGIVLLGVGLAVAISVHTGIEVPTAVGMLSGATTNTPSLGAAQTALRDLPSYTHAIGQLPALGYAVAYPFGIIGVILVMVLARPLFSGTSLARADNLSSVVTRSDPPAETSEPSPGSEAAAPGNGDSLQILPLFLGIALGVVLGSIPLPIRGLPAPLRLGLAGGPLIVAVVLSSRGQLGPLCWRMPAAANALLREVGIVLFLACVGLMAGGRFVSTLTEGDGLRWMAWATIITFVPMMLAALYARIALKLDYASTCGVLAGSMTDPAALAFATTSTRSEATIITYATVYPLTMVLRLLSTQIFVLVLMR